MESIPALPASPTPDVALASTPASTPASAPASAPAPVLRPIDRIRRAFARTPERIEIPEWADEVTGKPMVVLFGPMTVADLAVIKSAAEEVGEASEARSLRLLIHKALGEDGKPLFTMGDYEYLRTEIPWAVLQRLITFMWSCGALTPKEAKDTVKNSPSSATT
jgi:hypothetical protein